MMVRFSESPLRRLKSLLATKPNASALGRWLSDFAGRAGRAALSAGIIALVTAVLFLLIEGAASVIVVGKGSPGAEAPSGFNLLERSHTEYDSDLGWINEPNVRVDDLYGPGLYLQTNSQRFRNARAFDPRIPTGKVRAICTGDSFTLGYGVKNDDAWCELLVRKDPRFETINMGQGGYGVDQAYLWYRRDGLAFQHDVLIFGFIAGDFGRMMQSRFMGYPKPVLTVRNGAPHLLRSAGSRLSLVAPWLRQRARRFSELRVLELLRGRSQAASAPDSMVMTEQQARDLALAILDDLKGSLAKRATNLLVVLLPIIEDYRSSEADAWREFLKRELSKRQILFVDLVEALRKEPAELVSRLYRGHYNELGNRWVAEQLYAQIVEMPSLKQRLERIGPPKAPITSLMPSSAQVALEAIPMSTVKIHATHMSDLAGLAIDGTPSTRWHSGALQRGNEALVLDLGASQPVRQITLDLGSTGYDFGRSLAVDAGVDEAHYREVLRVRGEDVKLQNAIRSGESQILLLPQSVTARYLRIRQLARTDENFWSVSEVELFREKG